ncbi:MAG: o-succinylbenzoate--CoA ligase [Arcanobacterium sp.]|nr:o-succinylbenzoate--CoA ligase [Arcanobacterium sp.]
MDNWLRKRALIQPDSLALVYRGHEWSFSDLFTASVAMARTLAESLQLSEEPHSSEASRLGGPTQTGMPGVARLGEEFRQGEAGAHSARVGLLCNNSDASYIAILALMNLGVQIVMLNTRLSPDELRYQVHDAQLTQVLYTDDAEPTARELPTASVALDTLWAAVKAELASGEYHPSRAAAVPQTANPVIQQPSANTNTGRATATGPYVRPDFNLDDVMSILYTSGTTGEPKGVMQSYGNHYWSAISGVLSSGISATDAWVCFTPLYHISGLSILIRGLIYGMPVYLFHKFDPHAVNDVLLEGKANIVSVVAYALRKLLADLEDREAARYPATFRYMLLGGGFFEDSLLKSCERHEVPVIRSFGMSETCSQIIATPVSTRYLKPGASGVPLFPNQLRIGDGTIPVGAAGEIQIKAPALCVGYLNKPEKYAAAFTADGWYKTGDLGAVDADGFLYVKSRLADLIISGGENIYPTEVEHCLLQHPAIAEVAVVGHADSEWGFVPWAYLVAAPIARSLSQNKANPAQENSKCALPSDTELISFVRTHLAAYKVPKKFIWLDQLPKTSIGKIQKFKLLELGDSPC